MIRIDLDSVRRERGKSEWRSVNRASACGLESVGDGNNIVLLCRKLLDLGHSGDVEVWRGATPVFAAISLESWAKGKALNTREQPKHLRNWRKQ